MSAAADITAAVVKATAVIVKTAGKKDENYNKDYPAASAVSTEHEIAS